MVAVGMGVDGVGVAGIGVTVGVGGAGVKVGAGVGVAVLFGVTVGVGVAGSGVGIGVGVGVRVGKRNHRKFILAILTSERFDRSFVLFAGLGATADVPEHRAMDDKFDMLEQSRRISSARSPVFSRNSSKFRKSRVFSMGVARAVPRAIELPKAFVSSMFAGSLNIPAEGDDDSNCAMPAVTAVAFSTTMMTPTSARLTLRPAEDETRPIRS